MRTKLNRGELQGCPVSGESVKKVGGPFLSQGKLRPPQQRTARKGAALTRPDKSGHPLPRGEGWISIRADRRYRSAGAQSAPLRVPGVPGSR